MEPVYGHSAPERNGGRTGCEKPGPGVYDGEVHERIAYGLFAESAELFGEAELHE